MKFNISKDEMGNISGNIEIKDSMEWYFLKDSLMAQWREKKEQAGKYEGLVKDGFIHHKGNLETIYRHIERLEEIIDMMQEETKKSNL